MPTYEGGLFDPPAPLAKVTLRNPETGAVVTDVPALLDSGADVTLLPLAVAARLGLSIDDGAEYELRGFDGKTSVARAVRLDLLFLRRAFKGQFLLIDEEWGVIGRDVLNHLSLLFDGPRLAWDEQPATEKT